mmetsp:Transcript_13809/g.13387  ORF Transcript_13809/g.13387 Transcript_13809/m.13387 type:complete len:80 (-) Transcript_13809:33-272(-)
MTLTVTMTLPAKDNENDIKPGGTMRTLFEFSEEEFVLGNRKTIPAPIHVDAPAIAEKYSGIQSSAALSVCAIVSHITTN